MISLNLPRETRNTLTLNSPAVPLSSPIAWQLLSGGGDSDSGESVNPATAMQTATVNACVRLLSSSVASMTPILYRRQSSGKSIAYDNPLHAMLCVEPNPNCSSFTLWEAFMRSVCLTGNGFLEIQRDGLGTVQGLWYLRPDSITPFIQNDGSLAYRCTQGAKAGQFRVLRPENVIHVPWSSSDGITGVSPISEARNAVGAELAMGKFAAKFFRNSALPQLALMTKQKVRPEDRGRLRTDWEALQGGQNQHRIAVIDQDADLKVLSLSNEDSQFLESRRYSREEICSFYGLKPSQIGSESRVAGETFSGQQLSFLVDVLNPWAKRIAQELRRKLLKGLPEYVIEHDVSDRIRLDTESQLKAFAVGRQWGLLTANECRKQLGLDPAGPEADLLWRPVNMADADSPNTIETEGTENV